MVQHLGLEQRGARITQVKIKKYIRHWDLQYSKGHSLTNHCDIHITFLGDMYINIILLNLFQ